MSGTTCLGGSARSVVYLRRRNEPQACSVLKRRHDVISFGFTKIVPFGRVYLSVAFCVLMGCTDISSERIPAKSKSLKAIPKPVHSSYTVNTNDAVRRAILSVDDANNLTQEERETPHLRSARLYPGSGPFISRPKHVPAVAELTDGGGVKLNFVNAPIMEVVQSVLGGVLGQNFVFDEKVRGRVTMRTTRSMPRDAVLSVLETVLRQNGAALLKEGEIYRVIPETGLPRETAELRADANGALVEAGHAFTIAPLAYIAAAEMKKILQPIAPKDGILYVDTKRNLLMLSGNGHQISAMQKTISAFDIDWMAGTSSAIFPLEFVDAQTAHAELQSILLGEKNEQHPDSLRLMPISRLNAILAISPIRRNIEHVHKWIRRIDVPGDTAKQKVFLYPVQNGSARDLAAVLNKFFKSESTDAVSGDLTSPLSKPVRLSSPPKQTQSVAPPRSTTVPPPVKVADYGGETSNSGAASADVNKPYGPVHIVEDESRNALLISATTRDYRNIKKLLRKLDVPPLQVLIEATIAEVKLRDDLRYGLQWFFRKGKSEFTLSEIASGAVAPTFPGFSYLFAGSDARVAFDMLTSLTDVQIMSSPQLMVMNNTSARLQVGDQVPVPVQSSVAVGAGDAPIVNTIQFRDTGVILQVKPRVNESGMVTLEISQEVSDAAPTTSSGIDAPTIQQRQLSSIVTVASGQTLALGGIIRKTNSVIKSGLPILSEIPILGALFGSTGTQEDRTELLILLTPRVVRDTKEAVAVTNELRRRFSRLEPLLQEHAREESSIEIPVPEKIEPEQPAGMPVGEQSAENAPDASVTSDFALFDDANVSDQDTDFLRTDSMAALFEWSAFSKRLDGFRQRQEPDDGSSSVFPVEDAKAPPLIEMDTISVSADRKAPAVLEREAINDAVTRSPSVELQAIVRSLDPIVTGDEDAASGRRTQELDSVQQAPGH